MAGPALITLSNTLEDEEVVLDCGLGLALAVIALCFFIL